MLVAPIVVALALAPAQVKEKLPPPPAAPPVMIKLGGKALAPVAVARPARDLAPPGLPGVGGADVAAGPGDEATLKKAKLSVTDPALLDFFRKRTPPSPPREQLAELVKRLSGPDLGARDAAQAELTTLGPAAVPVLHTAANNIDDAEGSRRAREVLAYSEGASAANLVVHAARLLASRKPARAAEVLIGYLPFAEDENAFQEVESALVAVAVHDGKADPSLLKALKDKLALRRGTVAHVLSQAGGQAYHSAIRPLLKDSQASVRLRAALGLMGAYDAEAVPALIDMLADTRPRLQTQAEEHLTQLAGEWAVAGPKGNDPMSRQLRRDIWAAWWKNIDGSRLIDEFRSRTLSDNDLTRINGLIAKLVEDNPAVREAAKADLVAAGKSAVPLLRRAINDNDTKISAAAAQCLEAIDKDDLATPLPSAAVRLLGLRRPAGTVETLLAYLPCCESEELREQFVDILAAVGCTNGAPDATLVKALEDRIPARRGAAAMALCRGKALAQAPGVRKLLKDADLDVRLRTAQGLALAGEKEAIPALIALLKDLPIDQTWDVEEYLSQVAGDKAPTETMATDPAARARVVEAWGKWWKENSDKVDLTQGEGFRREAGLLTVVESWNPMFSSGRVLEVDRAGKIRWEIRNLQYPTSAQVLRGGNILIVEANTGRLSERDQSGKVVGIDRVYPNLFLAERQRDGKTFLAGRQHIYLLDSKGTVTFEHTYAMNSILGARRFRDGGIAYVSYAGHYVRLDRSGKEVKNVQLANWNVNSPTGAEILPGDRVVVTEQRFNRVVEYGLDGKAAWQTTIRVPMSPLALPNGNILVTGDSQQSIFEIDRKGKIVREWKGLAYRPFRVARR